MIRLKTEEYQYYPSAFSLQPSAWTDAGNYQVIITNIYGSVTSSPAITLTVTNAVPPTTVTNNLYVRWLYNSNLNDSISGLTMTDDTTAAYTNYTATNTVLNVNGSAAAYVVNSSLATLLSGTNSWSVSCWFEFYATNNISGNGWRIWSYGDGGTSSSQLMDVWVSLSSGSAYLGWNAYGDGSFKGNYLSPQMPINANTPYNLTVTRNGTNLCFYLNGALKYQDAGWANGNASASAARFCVGEQYNRTSTIMNGWVDDTLIYTNKALTLSEVQNNAAAGAK